MSSWNGIRDQVRETYRDIYGPKQIDWPMLPSGNLLGCDVTDASKLGAFGNVWKQDIYVINYLLSEIFNDEPGLRSFISDVALFADPGARFVFIERNGPMWIKQIARIARDSNLQLTQFKTSRQSRLVGEDPADLGVPFEILQDRRSPRSTWNIVYSIGVKR
jgi:hypothetical protein